MTASPGGIYVADFASEVLGSPRLLIDGRTQPNLELPHYADTVAWHDEEWLIVEEARLGYPTNVLHIVRMDTGCTYPSATLSR